MISHLHIFNGLKSNEYILGLLFPAKYFSRTVSIKTFSEQQKLKAFTIRRTTHTKNTRRCSYQAKVNIMGKYK